jgi:hypothetical protein
MVGLSLRVGSLALDARRYVYFEDDGRVVIVTVQDARSSRAARSGN